MSTTEISAENQQNTPPKKGKPRGKPFKKGQSGNPKGKPPGTVSITTAIKAKMMEIYPDPKDLKSRKTYLDRTIEAIMNNALKREEPGTLSKIWAYMDGQPKATIDIGADKQSLLEMTDFFRKIGKQKKK